jgi:Domain of unknown function (DUF6321)
MAAKKTKSKKASARNKPVKKTTRKAAKKSKARKNSSASREKDPRGGLTAAGRRAFAKKDGSHLKPGVTKKASDMTPSDMRRKGSWAVRFYGRAKLPPLVDAEGTRSPPMRGASRYRKPSPRPDASPPRVSGCCNAIGEPGRQPGGEGRRDAMHFAAWNSQFRDCAIWGRFGSGARNN